MKKHLLLFVPLAASNFLIAAADILPLRYLGALLLLAFLPGMAFLKAGFPWPERIVFAFGFSYAFSLVSALFAHYLPGKMSALVLLLACDAAALSVWFLVKVPGTSKSARHLREVERFSRLDWVLLILLVSAAFFFRLASLGYSEFQGDEALAMLRAAQAIEGREDALFVHGKGPAEVLLPASLWLLAGRIDEFGARLPFALVSALGVFAFWLLGRRMLGGVAGWGAGFLLAINGYFVGFGRVVQYQSLVFLMMGLALLCYYRFYAEGADRCQLLGALFAAVGLLAHYDMALVLPALLFLYVAGLRRWGMRPWHFFASLALGATIVGSFYLPFWRDRQAQVTYRYLAEVRLGAGPTNNLHFFFLQSAVYNSIYYIVVAAFLPLIALARRLCSFRGGLHLWLPAFFIALGLAAFMPSWWVALPLAFLFAALFFALENSVWWKAGLLVFAVPFFFYIFVVERPLTHVYTFLPGAALLAGVGLGDMRGAWPDRGKFALASLAAAFYFLCGGYLYLVFIRPEPEYIWTYPIHRSPLYPLLSDVGAQLIAPLPPAAFFGFPYRAGWSTIGLLYEEGLLRGDYGSNEEGEITAWYVPGALRSYCTEPEYYIIADRVRDERLGRPDALALGYVPAGAVTVGEHVRLRLYRHPKVPGTSEVPGTYPAERSLARAPAEIVQRPQPSYPAQAELGDKIRLLGYDLNSDRAEPGGTLILTLYWEALSPMEIDYSVFIHIESNRIWGQYDGLPLCGFYRTSDWRPGDVVIERYRIPVSPQIPPGSYPLLVGMYSLADGRRLPVSESRGGEVEDSIFLQEVTVK